MLCSERGVRCCCDDMFFCAACHLRLLQSSVDESRRCQLREVGEQRAFCITDSFLRYKFVFVFVLLLLGHGFGLDIMSD